MVVHVLFELFPYADWLYLMMIFTGFIPPPVYAMISILTNFFFDLIESFLKFYNMRFNIEIVISFVKYICNLGWFFIT